MGDAFSLISETDLPEYRATGVWVRHSRTGCELFHVRNDDPENLFSFVFKTLPADSTGVAHILEHTVLCGSERYPVKDPFVMLMRGSPNTFVNAMTYPDKTLYPASSTVRQDLFNIMNVYGDAVFSPLLRPEFFRQEGHRLQIGEDGALDITGIVYNEMKGSYANHDSVVAEWSYRSLLPDTPYGYDSGGDPAEIPDLSYDSFVAFHRTFYHPSNARIFLYGDIPTEDYMEFLDTTFLSKFGAGPGPADVPLQPRWTEPRVMTMPCPSDEEGVTSVTVNWLLDQNTDPDRVIGMELLAEILLGTSAAPLRKRLIDSGLGEDLSAATGLETELQEIVFCVGLRGTESAHRDTIESIVFDELSELVRGGIDADIIEGAMRKVEFRNRELRGGPNGLRLMGRSLRGWLHGQSPVTTLRFEGPFARLRKDAAPGTRYFENLIRERLVNNTHRSTVIVVPDPGQRERERLELQRSLRETAPGRAEADLDRIRGENERLLELQQTPDPPEAVSSIPFLKLSDMPTRVDTIPTHSSEIAGVPVHGHDLFTNGIVYLDLVFDISTIPDELSTYLPFYAGSLGEVGLPGRTFDLVATDVALKTGGLFVSLDAAEALSQGNVTDRRFYVRLKTLESTLDEAADLLAAILTQSDLTDEHRLGDLWKERRSEMSGSILPGGSGFAALRAGRHFSSSDRHHEVWQGVSQLVHLNRAPTGVGEILSRLNRAVVNRAGVLVNLTGDANALSLAMPHVERLLTCLPSGNQGSTATDGHGPFPREEALIVPSDVAYVAAAMPAAGFGTPEHAHELVLAHLLRTGFLWESIRMTGGAYGAGASARGLDRTFVFSSYRDPRIVETVEAFAGGLELYASGRFESADLELAQIGVTGHDIRPMSPRQKGVVALRRMLYGVTDEMRQAKRDAVLCAKPHDIRRASERLRDSMKEAAVAVLAGKEAVQAASVKHPGFLDNQTIVPL